MGVVTRKFEVGQAAHIGGHPATPMVAPREIQVTTDARGSVSLVDQVRLEDGAEVVAVLVAPKGRPGLWRRITIDRERVRERLQRGDLTPRPTEEGSMARRDLTPTEQAKADSLAQWLLKRGCRP